MPNEAKTSKRRSNGNRSITDSDGGEGQRKLGWKTQERLLTLRGASLPGSAAGTTPHDEKTRGGL